MLHQVGVGALGPVFRTYEPTRDRLVAVKVFRLDITPEQALALADELSVATQAALFHPSVVEPIAAGVEGTVAYRAEEYVAAESLDVAMRHYAPAAMEKVLPFISQLAAAVDFARLNGIGHGALHPRDIFVTPDEARATGFGVVEALERVGLRAPVRRPYSAPERVAGEQWGTTADVFSLGAIAYELLTGRRPAGVGSAIGDLTGASDRHAGEIHAVLVRAMEESPASRYPTAMGFASALEAASRGETTPAGPPFTAETTPVGQPTSAETGPVNQPFTAETGPESQPFTAETAPEAAVAAAAAAVPKRRTPSSEPPKPLPPPEPEIDDITPELEEDDAFVAFASEESESARERTARPARDLFDVEPVEDLSIDREPERYASDFDAHLLEESVPAPRFASTFDADPPVNDEPERTFEREPRRSFEPELDDEDDVHTYVPTRRSIDYVPDDQYAVGQPPRRRTLPLMLMLMLGLLIGFGLGFGAGYGAGTQRADKTTDAEADAGDNERPAAGAAAGKPYSEQAVTPSQEKPSSAAPPIPGDAPAPSSAPSPAPAGSPSAPRDTGRLIVRSVPANAGVTIDGTWRGRTPLTLDKLRLGTHEVRIVQAGYAVATQSVALTAKAPARTLSFRLERERGAPAAKPADKPARTEPSTPPRSGLPPVASEPRGPGSLYVDSRPRGAAVFLDGRQVAVTPATIPDVPPGPHVIRLQLPDHRVWTANSQVLAGQQTRVTGSLERIR